MQATAHLNEAIRALKDRADSRDQSSGERSMVRTVNMFNELYDGNMTEEQGWMFMVLLKVVRSAGGAYRPDDYTDLAGYAALAGETAEKERQ